MTRLALHQTAILYGSCRITHWVVGNTSEVND